MRLLFICAVCGCILALFDRDYSEAAWAAWAGFEAFMWVRFNGQFSKD